MANPKISVIVPVYNVELYVSRCIESILAQTFNDFELLLINDGSTDKSGIICDQYAKTDKRIRVFNKKNGGVSSARNLGLSEAIGEWISFIDADDWLSADFFQIGDHMKADVIQKSYYENNELTSEVRKIMIRDYELTEKEKIYRFFVKKRNNALWDKIIYRNAIKDNRFNENVNIGEDFLFFLSIIRNINTYAFSSIGHYNYVIREGSAMQVISGNPIERMQVLVQNMVCVNEIIPEEKFELLRYGIIYSTYVNGLFFLLKYLSKREIFLLDNLFRNMKWKNLSYISIKEKSKLYQRKIVFMFSILRRNVNE